MYACPRSGKTVIQLTLGYRDEAGLMLGQHSRVGTGDGERFSFGLWRIHVYVSALFEFSEQKQTHKKKTLLIELQDPWKLNNDEIGRSYLKRFTCPDICVYISKKDESPGDGDFFKGSNSEILILSFLWRHLISFQSIRTQRPRIPL